MKSFVHLHNHTQYSLFDGLTRIPEMVKKAKEEGMPAVAITDHGNMYGLIHLYKAAREQGIKPILGCEIYMTRGSRFEQKTKERLCHLILLAKNTAGYHNLVKIVSKGFVDGENNYHRPRVDFDLLEQYHEGLIALSACIEGQVQQDILNRNEAGARRTLERFIRIFGKDDFYLEIQNHGLPEEKEIRRVFTEWSKEYGLKLVATNDFHYLNKEDAPAQEVKLCISTGSTLDDPAHFRFSNNEFYMKTREEMEKLFPDHIEALDTTLEIADKCNVEISFNDRHLPRFPVPEGETAETYLRKICEEALPLRYDPVTAEVRQRLDYELGVISAMDFPSYFLIVWDYVKYARDHEIPVGPGRGSAAGSVVAYLLGITGLDPLKYNLLFERFLNPERITMPDIDMDFCYENRNKIIDYVTRKYGKDHVAQIITFGTLAARAVLRDVGRVLNMPLGEVNRIMKTVPNELGITLDKALQTSKEFRQDYETKEEVRRLVDYGKVLEGLVRHSSTHAAGVVISAAPVDDYVPMQYSKEGYLTTQYDKDLVEELGLLKMDFLGLRNLTVISDALEGIVANGKEPLDIDHIELDDPATYELLSRGETLGVFQLDGGGMRTLLRLMKPDNFEDISAVGALYRPGPMGAESHTNYALRKNGLQEIVPIHPELKEALEPILGDTYGLIVYQEQVMRIATDLAGFSMGKADALRKAMGKKKMDILAKMFVDFEAGMVEGGFSKESVKTLWDVVVPFAKYAFNKAHSAAYGVVSYWTAYLKTHYPTEYMAALLTSQKDNKDKLAIYLGECRHMGITVLPPDVNASRAQFSADGEDIRFGLAAVRNVGLNVVDAIVTARENKGEFTSFEDFLDKVPAVVCNKRTIDSLIKAGAFDTLGRSRRSLQACHEEFVDEIIGVKRNEAAGQFDLFASMMGDGGGPGGTDDPFGSGPVFSSEVPDLPEWDKKDKLAYERDMLGLYVSDHPLLGLEGVLGKLADTEIADLVEDEERPDGAMVTIAGLITGLTRKTTKQGNLWAIAQIEDLGGSIEALFFPSTYQTVSTMLAPDTVVTVRGRLNRRDGQVALYAQEMTLPDVSSATHEAVTITLPTNRCTAPLVERFKAVLENHPGMSTVRLNLTSPGREVRTQLDSSLRVEASAAFYSDIKALLGPGCLRS